MKRFIIVLLMCMGVMTTILCVSKFSKVKPSLSTKELYYGKETLSDNATIQYPGLIDYSLLKADVVFRFMRTKSCIATIKNVDTLYKKGSQENTYVACNIVKAVVEKNICGGFRNGEHIYVMDPEMVVDSDDIGKSGLFIPDNIETKINVEGQKNVICTVGNIKESESRFFLEEDVNYINISNYWLLKHYMKKKKYLR